MKYYDKLLGLQCFSRSDVEKLTGNVDTAKSLLSAYKKKGLVQSIKRNLYGTISLETGAAVANRYFIGSHITEDAYLTHHSAFEYYGCANQVYHEVYVSGAKKFTPFTFEHVTYRYVAPRIMSSVDEKEDGVRVTSMERTVLDSINDLDKIAGLEEVVRCLELVPYVNEDKMLDMLHQYGKQVLYQKAGYILGHFKKEFRLSDAFFDICAEKVGKSIRYLNKEIKSEPNTYNKKWQLFVPGDLMKQLDPTYSE